MPALPWTTISSPDRAGEYVVMASRLPLARYRDMPIAWAEVRRRVAAAERTEDSL